MIDEFLYGTRRERRFWKRTGRVWAARTAAVVGIGAALSQAQSPEPSVQAPAVVPAMYAELLHCEQTPRTRARVLPVGKQTLKLFVDGKTFGAAEIGLFKAKDGHVITWYGDEEAKPLTGPSPVAITNNGQEAAVVKTASTRLYDEAAIRVTCEPAAQSTNH